MVKTIMYSILTFIVIVAGIFVGCTVSPKFRDTYTGLSNKYEMKIHDFVEEHIGVDMPYTQYTTDGRIVVVK